MEVLNLIAGYFGGWVFPYISRIHTAYLGFRISILGTWNVGWLYDIPTTSTEKCSENRKVHWNDNITMRWPLWAMRYALIRLMEEILHQLIGQGFLHPRWCRISSINSRSHGSVGWKNWSWWKLPVIGLQSIWSMYFNHVMRAHKLVLNDSIWSTGDLAKQEI